MDPGMCCISTPYTLHVSPQELAVVCIAVAVVVGGAFTDSQRIYIAEFDQQV